MASSEYEALEARLVNAGAPTSASKGPLEIEGPIEVLVNSRVSALPYEDLLLDALPRLGGNELEMVVRALTERGMKRAGPALVELMAAEEHRGKDGLLWSIGNALNTINDRRTYGAVLTFCAEGRLGMARQMLFTVLSNIRTDEAFRCALAGVDDPTVRGHAIEALGRFGRPDALPVLHELKTQPGLYEHKAKATAIRRLERAKAPRAR
jgi:HEAT repeat protein